MNDFSVQPVKEHLLDLAEVRLRNHPGMYQMLKHKLATGSPRASLILDCLVPGEWVYALKASRDFSSVDAKLIRAIDSWVNSRPTSKTVVVPLPAPYLPVGEPQATVAVAPPKQTSVGVTVHTTKFKKKDHHLLPSIEEAQKGLSDKYNATAVWANLQGLANKKFSNLLGATEEGIQYLSEGITKYFKKAALTEYLNRQHKKDFPHS
jgi:hypothetical protein